MLAKPFPDIVVNKTVLVEVKALRALAPEHQAQVINDLRATGIEIGPLIDSTKTKDRAPPPSRLFSAVTTLRKRLPE